MTRPAPAVRRSKPAPAWDAPITVALLVSGVLNVTYTVASMRNLAFTLDQGFVAAGIGHYTSFGLADGIGWAVSAVDLLALVVAIGLAVPRLRTHRPAFWIPLLAAVVAFALTAALVVAAYVSDPAFLTWVQHHSG